MAISGGLLAQHSGMWKGSFKMNLRHVERYRLQPKKTRLPPAQFFAQHSGMWKGSFKMNLRHVERYRLQPKKTRLPPAQFFEVRRLLLLPSRAAAWVSTVSVSFASLSSTSWNHHDRHAHMSSCRAEGSHPTPDSGSIAKPMSSTAACPHWK